MSSLQVTIGLFCLWIFSLDNLLGYLSARLDVDPHKIVRIDLADTYKIYTEGKVYEIPISEVMPYVMNKCRTCMDFTSELADICWWRWPPPGMVRRHNKNREGRGILQELS